MANLTNIIQTALDNGDDLATLLATAYRGTTVGKLINDLKSDSSGTGDPLRVPDGQINEALMNLIDDFLQALYTRAGAAWESVYSRDLTAEANQSVDGSDNLTVGGVTWYGRDFDGGGGRTDKNEITNGVGLELDTQDGSGDGIFEIFGASTEAPVFEISLADLYDFRWTDKIRIVADVNVDFDNDNSWAFAGIMFRMIRVPSGGKGTKTTHSFQVLRSNNNANGEETRVRSNDSLDGAENTPHARPGIDDQADCSLMAEWDGGVYRGYIGAAYSGGWPAWEMVDRCIPSQDAQQNIANFNESSGEPFDLRMAFTVARVGNFNNNARMNVKRIQVYRQKNGL